MLSALYLSIRVSYLMIYSKRERQRKIAEMAPVVRIFATIFCVIALIYILPLESISHNSFDVILLSLQLISILAVLVFFTIGFEEFRGKLTDGRSGEPIALDYVTLLGSCIFLSLIILVTGGNESHFKILFLPTILFYTVRFGLSWGMAASGMAAFTLTAANLLSVFQHKGLNLELDIIYVGVFFLTSWLVGTMVEMEWAISDRLSSQVNRDDLTGFYNYRFLQEELKRKVKEEKTAPFALIKIDLDYFKYYNEVHGYQAGDRLLIEVAEKIVDVVGGSGKVFRHGSDEFVVIMEHGDNKKALEMAEKIRRGIKDNFTISSPDDYWEHELTVSLGLAFYPADGTTGEEILTKADQALYKAKEISGNKVEAYFSVLEYIKSHLEESEKEAFNKLGAFLAIINAKDHYTYGHSERVLIYASIIASLIGVPLQAKKYLQYGAYLHDIGKIEIDRAILNHPGGLDKDDWKIIKKHPLWGADIARQIRVLAPAIPAILFHHERYDGMGYPFNLSGKEIPLEGRIMALADAFDAMTVDRPYRRAISYEEAIVEIGKNKMTQFDPSLVDLFTDFLKQYQGVHEILTPEVKNEYLL